MAEEATKKNKGLIIGICCGIVAIIVAVVLIVIFVIKPGGFGGGLSDEYFKSDDTKLVMTLDAGEASYEDQEHAPNKTHMVHYYSGDKITGMSVFYEYAEEAAAKTAYNYIDEEAKENAKEIKIRGRYIEIVMKENLYSDTTPEEVEQQIKFMEMLKKKNRESSGVIDSENDEGEEGVVEVVVDGETSAE